MFHIPSFFVALVNLHAKRRDRVILSCLVCLILPYYSTLSHTQKCILVQALRLSTGRTAHRGSIDVALAFLDHCTRRGWGVSVTPRPLLTPGKDQVPIVQEDGWAPVPVWTGAENFAYTGIRSPDRPARRQSLDRLRYTIHTLSHIYGTIFGKNKYFDHKIYVLILSQNLSEIFIILRRIYWNIIIFVLSSSYKVAVILVRFE